MIQGLVPAGPPPLALASFSGTRACNTGAFAPAIEAAVAAPVHFRKLRREIGLSTPRDIGISLFYQGMSDIFMFY
jgi:hypothetical protein